MKDIINPDILSEYDVSLSSSELKMVTDLAQLIDFSALEKIAWYGSTSQANLSTFSTLLLKHAQTSKIPKVTILLDTLANDLERIVSMQTHEEAIPSRKELKELVDKVDALSAKFEEASLYIGSDIQEVKRLQSQIKQVQKEIIMYMLAGAQSYSKNYDQISELTKSNFLGRIESLELSLKITKQLCLQVQSMLDTDLALDAKVSDSRLHAIPFIKKQFSMMKGIGSIRQLLIRDNHEVEALDYSTITNAISSIRNFNSKNTSSQDKYSTELKLILQEMQNT